MMVPDTLYVSDTDDPQGCVVGAIIDPKTHHQVVQMRKQGLIRLESHDTDIHLTYKLRFCSGQITPM